MIRFIICIIHWYTIKADILETYLFRNGVVGGDYSMGTALGLFNSVIALILILIANKVIKRLGGDGIW